MLQWDDLKRASDKDGDGLISRKEFLGYIMGEEQLDAKGGFVDADRESEIRQQIKAAIRTTGPAGKLVGQLFDVVDADGSGALEEAEGKEFIQLLGVEDEAEIAYAVGQSSGHTVLPVGGTHPV